MHNLKLKNVHVIKKLLREIFLASSMNGGLRH